MAEVVYWYSQVIASAFAKEINLTGDSLKIMLVNGYSFDQDAHDYKNDITDEVTGTGYTAGGQALVNPTFTYTSGTNTWKFDADNPAWSASTIAAATGAVIYDDTPATAGTKPLICYIDFGTTKASSAALFTITFHVSNGINTMAFS